MKSWGYDLVGSQNMGEVGDLQSVIAVRVFHYTMYIDSDLNYFFLKLVATLPVSSHNQHDQGVDYSATYLGCVHKNWEKKY